MIGRRVRSAGSLVWLVVVGAAILAGLAISGCGRRTYPLRDPPLTPAQIDGAVEIGVGFNQCPEVTFNVSPSEGERSQPFDIEGVATDPDNDSLTLSVKADSGKLSVNNQLPSTFTCTTPGLVTITVTASDGKCQTAKTATVFCLGSHPTDGGADGPDGSSGPDGGRDGSSDGGDGGTTVVMNTCAGMTPTELPSGGPDCTDCTNNNCSLASAAMGGTDGCCGLASPADQVLCIAAVQCFSTHSCTVSGDATRCFCGTTQSANCFAVPGAANGACVAEVVAANKSNDPGMIKAFLTSASSPLGRAFNLLGCRGSFCSTECSVK